MKNKWYISLLVIALAIVGVSLDKSSVANQEIILKFTNLEVSENESREVLGFVKNQLEGVAVSNIQIQKSQDGTLKITYHSTMDVSEIKVLLSQTNHLVLDMDSGMSTDELPFSNEGDVGGYQIDVFEIQPAKDLAGATGTVVDVKTEIIRFFTPDANTTSVHLERKDTTQAKVLYTVCNSKTLLLNDGFCLIPQVRAGPIVA